MNWKEAKKVLLEEDPLLKEELLKLEPKYQLIEKIIELRKENKLTQADLADRINDKQANIARLENGNSNPSLEKLLKIAKGLNADLKIDLIPKAIKI
jgi:transcriptional regulator with XRE-family HTH domain